MVSLEEGEKKEIFKSSKSLLLLLLPGHLVAVEVDHRVGDLDLGDWSFGV